MMSRLFAILGLLFVFFSSTTVTAQGEFDFFWSDKDLHQGAVNGNLVIDVEVGDIVPLYLYWSTNGPADSDISVGCAVDVTTSQTGITAFRSARSLDFGIFVDDFHIGNRWLDENGGGGSAGDVYELYDDFIDALWAFTVNGGQGILESNSTGQPFLDAGYDAGADAFMFGDMTFEALAPGQVQFITVTDESLCVNGANVVKVSHSLVTVNVSQNLLLGDVNLDGAVNLLDVTPFVQILSDLGYQAEADINQDGAVDLLDVPLFVDLISP